MLALAWMVYGGFGITTASLPALITPIRAELALTYSQVGVLLGAWQLVYIAVAYPAGMLVDRLGTRRALTIGAVLIATSGLVRALAFDFTTLFLSVAIFGLGGPIVSVGAPKVIASWFSGRPRATAAGIYATGSATGSALSLSATNSVVLPLLGSWQLTCAAYGTTVLVIATVWWLLARNPPPRKVTAGGSAMLSFRAACLRVTQTPAVWLIVIVGFTSFMLGHGFRTWLPQILEAKGLTAVQAGYLAALPGLSGIVGSITISRIAASVGRKRMVRICLVGVALALMGVDRLDGPLLVAALAFQGFSAGAISPLLMSLMMDLREVGPEAMGAAAGIYFAVGEVGGFSGPSLIGLLKDLSGSFTLGIVSQATFALVMLIPTLYLREIRLSHRT